MSVHLSPEITVTSAEEAKAKELCFAICKTGGFLDFEAGCISICKSPSECGGWVPYLSAAQKVLSKEPSR